MFYFSTEKTSPKRRTLLIFEGCYVYLIKKWTFILKLLYVGGGKRESATFSFIKVSVLFSHLAMRERNFNRNLSYYELKGHTMMIKDEKRKNNFF